MLGTQGHCNLKSVRPWKTRRSPRRAYRLKIEIRGEIALRSDHLAPKVLGKKGNPRVKTSAYLDEKIPHENANENPQSKAPRTRCGTRTHICVAARGFGKGSQGKGKKDGLGAFPKESRGVARDWTKDVGLVKKQKESTARIRESQKRQKFRWAQGGLSK